MIKKIESLEDYKEQYQKSVESPEQFWSEIANTFSWRKTWDHVVDWDFKELDVKCPVYIGRRRVRFGYCWRDGVAYYDESVDMTVKNRKGYYALR